MAISSDSPRVSAPLPDTLVRAFAANASRLGGLGGDVRFFESVGSTNDIARDLACGGCAVGTMVMARRQTAGRGRRGRTWFSPSDAGLYVSLVLEPVAGSLVAGQPATHGVMTLAAGVALAAGIERTTGVPVRIKWPNDLVIERAGGAARRKLGGILAEGIVRDGRLDRLVLGFGVNLEPAAYPPELATVATSLAAETTTPVDRAELLMELLGELHRVFARLAAGGSADVLAEWTARSPSCRGATVEWTDAGRARSGTTAGVDVDGALLVDTAAGRARLVSADVTWS